MKSVFTVSGMIDGKPLCLKAFDDKQGNLMIVFNQQNSHDVYLIV
jgi:hypothetical protein